MIKSRFSMKKLKLNLKNIGEILTREQLKQVVGGSGSGGGSGAYGTPGGDNGNPCPQYCEPTGGSIMCTGTIEGVIYIYEGNCNNQPYNSSLHNICISANGSYW